MRISSIYVHNFRKLRECRIEFSDETTVFVGANNSGKTSAMDALGKFLAGRNFVFNDITISNRAAINRIGERWIKEDCEIPENLMEWETIIPKMDIWIEVLPKGDTLCCQYHSYIEMAQWKIGNSSNLSAQRHISTLYGIQECIFCCSGN